MLCPSCRHENRPGAKFCEECATALRLACLRCGSELRRTAKFCDECGASVAGAVPAAPVGQPTSARKIVTVVFADLAGSTGLHERVDAESARRVMDAYYAALRVAVERHGGTVVKLLGDGVMAAFGVPHVAEDDAIRAVRAGVAMQEAFRALVAEQAAVLDDVGLRVAINTGEVVVSGDNDDVVGDPVNVAARLQQEARDGDVVVGEATRRLVDAIVTLEPLGSFALRGRAEAVKAHRVVSLDAPAGAATAAFVGREEELARIGAAYADAVRAPATRLAVLVGSPGLGKSRLIGEFGRRTGEAATVVAARCDAAGGTTFAPLAEALHELLGIEGSASADAVRTTIETALPSDDDAARIASGIAALLTGSPAAPEETFFVVRRLLAELAAAKPVVLVIDDLQWAEPLLLDLVEHLVQWGAGVPLLVLIGARPELRDVRSSLVTPGGLVSEVVTLSGLDAGAATRLAANVIGAADLPAAVAAKVLATSEGNPLFIGELVRMLVDEGALTREGDRWTAGTALATLEMPPTIHALLAARIERLRPEERTVLERAAVVGRHFSRSAVAALLPGAGADLDARLEALRRSELIERDTGWLLGEPVLRFHHVLIRDAAYRRLLKETRAELHERLADWIESRVGDAPEHDETIGRHLEQAHVLRGELGTLGDDGRRLGERASRWLAAAGRAALARDDVPLAAGLLGRSIARLESEDPTRADLALDWCDALLAAGDVGQAVTAIDELGRLASESPRLRAWQTCFTGQLTVLTAPEALRTTADAVAAAATELATLGDAAGEATAHYVQALALARLGQVGGCEDALDRALAAARRAGDRRRANTVLAIAPLAALWGPSPVTRASGRCLDVVRVLRITQGAPAVEAVALSCQGVLEALRGRTDAARRMIASAREMVEELGIAQRLFETDAFAGLVALLEGDGAAAERSLQGAYEGFRDLGLGIDAARAAALLGRALLAQGRAADAEALSHESEALAGDDLKAAIAWRGVRAEALARRGEHAAAVDLAGKAVGIASATDALLDHADARRALAVALRAAGRDREADAEERRAGELWAAKGATLLVERAGRRVATSDAARAGSERPGGSTARARVAPNLGTAMLARLEAAIADRDLDAVRATFRDDFEEVDHTLGYQYGLDEIIESVRGLLRARNPRHHIEPLATLGTTLLLARRQWSASGAASRRYDVGPYENEGVEVLEVDDHGLFVRVEVFACDHLGDAIARLYERHAELLSEGPACERAATMARLVTAMLTPASTPLEDVMAPDIQAVDHRTVGGGPGGGVELWSRWRSASDELIEESTYRVDDVLALGTEGLLRRTTESGTIRATGGTFANTSLLLSIFGPDGRQARFEMFDVGHEVEALARYDELTAAQEPPRPPSRPVRPNRATAMADRAAAAINARDMPAFERTVADDFAYVHHATGVTFGKREQLAVWRSGFRAERLTYRHEPLAVLGESLVLAREWASVIGLKERVLDAFGPAEIHDVFVAEEDGRGRMSRMEIFAPDRLGEAVARLYERHAELLPEGPARDHATAVARSVAIFTGPIDLERWATGFAPAVRCVDHRVFGPWTASDRAEALQHFRLQLDLAPDFTHRLDDVVAVEPHTLVVRDIYHGTARDGGGAFENPVCVAWTFGTDGLMTRSDVFEVEQTAEALAYVDELTTPATATPPLTRFENDASRHGATCVRLFATGDYDTHRGMFSEQFRYHDRRRLALLELDYDRFEAFVRYAADGRTSRVDFRTLATRGERLALWRAAVEVAGGDVGPSEIEFLNITELDDRGLAAAYVRFDPDDLDAAYAELDRCYAAQGADLTLGDAINRRQWDTLASFLAPTFVQYDHRRPSLLGTIHGPEDWVTGVRMVTELAPDVVIRVDHLRLHARGRLFQSTWHGTRDGGRFELPMLGVHELDEGGAIVRADLYDLDRADEAFARFDEIPATAGISSRRQTSASGTMDRIAEALAVGFETDDWSELRAICAPGFTFEDRQTHSRVSGDVEMLIASARERMRSGARAQRSTVGLMGDRIQFGRTLWVGGPPGGQFEIEYLATSEVDEAGRLLRFVMADVDAADELRRDAWARWVAIDPSVALHLEILGDVLRAWETQDVEAFAAILTENLIVEDRRRTGTGRSDGRAAYIRSVIALWDLAPDTHLDGGWDWLATAPGISAYRARRFGRVPDGGDFESDFLVVTVHENGKTSRIEVFEADDEAGALARFEALRPDRPTLVRRSVTMERAFEPIRTAWDRRRLDDIRTLVAPSFRYEDRGKRALVVGDVDTWIESMRFWPAGTHARTDEIVGTFGDRITVDRAGWSGTSDGAAFEIERLRLLEVDAEGRLCAAIHFDLDDRAAAFREAERRFRAGEAAGCESQAVVAEMTRRLDTQDWDGFRESLSPDLVHHDHRVLGLGSLDRDTWIASFRALADLAVELRQEGFGVLAWNRHGRVGCVRQRGMIKDGGPFENAFVALVMAAGGVVDRVEVFDLADADRAVERFEALSAERDDGQPAG